MSKVNIGAAIKKGSIHDRWMKPSSKRELGREYRYVNDSKELIDLLKSISKEKGGAWIFEIVPFSHDTYFIHFENPSSVPDYFIDSTKNRIGYNGKIVPFSKAAQIREQNRGYTADR